MTEVVDVFARASEVDEFAQSARLGDVAVEAGGEASLEVVLDGLDVVDRVPLDVGELGDVLGPEVVDDRAQPLLLALGERPDAGHDPPAGEVDEPFDLDVRPGAVQRRLGEVIHQRRDDVPVPAVECSQGDRWSEVGQ